MNKQYRQHEHEYNAAHQLLDDLHIAPGTLPDRIKTALDIHSGGGWNMDALIAQLQQIANDLTKR